MIKILDRDALDSIYELFLSSGKKTLLQYLGFIPTKKELEYHFFDDPDCNEKLLLGVYENNQLQGFIHAINRSWKTPSSNTGYIKWIQINEQLKNRVAIGELLLNSIEEQLTLLGCTDLQFGSASPYYLIPGIPVDDHFTRSLLSTNCNWEESSTRISLKIKPKSSDSNDEIYDRLKLKHNSYHLSTLLNNDAELESFITEHFSLSWAMEVKFGLSNIPLAHCSILRNNANDIVGFAAVNAVNRNWFGPMGISDKLRGKGLGKLILLHSINDAIRNGTQSLILSWVNDKADFYRQIFPDAEDILFKKFTKKIS